MGLRVEGRGSTPIFLTFTKRVKKTNLTKRKIRMRHRTMIQTKLLNLLSVLMPLMEQKR